MLHERKSEKSSVSALPSRLVMDSAWHASITFVQYAPIVLDFLADIRTPGNGLQLVYRGHFWPAIEMPCKPPSELRVPQ